jgi:hypothetical protein
LPLPAPASSGPSRGVLLLLAGVGVTALGVVALLVALLGTRATTKPAATPPSGATLEAATPPVAPSAALPAPEKTAAVRYPLRSLLGVSTAVDIDGSRAHMLGLFPSIDSNRHGNELRYVVPLEHRWFSEAELGWKNERAGNLTSVTLRPPEGDERFKNQQQIGDCLAKGLGKPEVRETDHLAGERSYFWGKNFPRAWADLYTSYFWLTFQNPRGIAPVTLENVVRTLDGCTP